MHPTSTASPATFQSCKIPTFNNQIHLHHTNSTSSSTILLPLLSRYVSDTAEPRIHRSYSRSRITTVTRSGVTRSGSVAPSSSISNTGSIARSRSWASSEAPSHASRSVTEWVPYMESLPKVRNEYSSHFGSPRAPPEAASYMSGSTVITPRFLKHLHGRVSELWFG